MNRKQPDINTLALANMPVLIVPGLNGSGEQHWQSLWQQQLPRAVRVCQTDWATPDIHRWSEQLLKTAKPFSRYWIVAHSFGVLTTLHALPFIREKVAGVFLVAPADPDKFGLRHYLAIADNYINGALVASHTDPWMSYHKAVELAALYGLPVLDAGNAGHINVESGHGAWPEGWSWLQGVVHEKQLEPGLQARGNG